MSTDFCVPWLPSLNFDQAIGADDWRVTAHEPYYEVELSYDYAQRHEYRSISGMPVLSGLVRGAAIRVVDGALTVANSDGVITLILAPGSWVGIKACEGVSLFNPGSDWIMDENSRYARVDWKEHHRATATT